MLLLFIASAGALVLSAPAPALADTGSISGTITGGDVSAVQVGVWTLQGSGVAVGSPDPMKTGAYTITGIPPGTYKVEFSIGDNTLGAQYYNSQSTFASATPVTVEGGKDYGGVDATMLPAGSIAGHVYDSSTNDPLGGVSVTVFNSAGEGAGNTTTSGTDGSYLISGLGDSKYQVRFLSYSGYDQQWYNGKDATTADWVSVSSGVATGGIDAYLVPAGGTRPVIDYVTSATNPDPTKWYHNSNPTFSWVTNAYTKTILGYSCTLDQSPATVPAETVNTTTAESSYSNVADGVWYFHVRAETSAGWSDTKTLEIQIDTVAPATTISGADGLWHNSAVPISLSASDTFDGSGVAATGYTVDGGAQQTYTAPFTLGEGAHTLTYWSVDQAGNVEATHTARADFDFSSPSTSASGVSAGWSKGPVAVALNAVDRVSGIAGTKYRLQGAPGWTTYSAPFKVSAQGSSTYQYFSTDNAGNVDSTQTCTVRIDAKGPFTLALAKASAKKGKRATFRFRVNDLTPSATVTLKVYKGKKLKATIAVGSRPTGQTQSYKWTCKLARGSYAWKVYAVDQAGNRQAHVGASTLKVK